MRFNNGSGEPAVVSLTCTTDGHIYVPSATNRMRPTTEVITIYYMRARGVPAHLSAVTWAALPNCRLRSLSSHCSR